MYWNTDERVMLRFLAGLVNSIRTSEHVPVPVLRGSLLLRHWFGDPARPAGDVDIELFDPDVSDQFDAGRCQTRHRNAIAVRPAWLIEMTRLHFESGLASSGITFREIESQRLWQYGTPGGRFCISSTIDRRNHQIQVDLASQGKYLLTELDIQEIVLPSDSKEPACTLAYSMEMMAAVKLSWVLRSLKTLPNGSEPILEFFGQPKDLFDLHLLLTNGDLHRAKLEAALATLCLEDDIRWHTLDWLANVNAFSGIEIHPEDWGAQFRNGEARTPVEMLQETSVAIAPLLPGFLLPAELPFLAAIQQNGGRLADFHVYGDWLSERDDHRSEFVREFAPFYAGESPTQNLLNMIDAQSNAWLLRLCGSNAAFRNHIKRLGNA